MQALDPKVIDATIDTLKADYQAAKNESMKGAPKGGAAVATTLQEHDRYKRRKTSTRPGRNPTEPTTLDDDCSIISASWRDKGGKTDGSTYHLIKPMLKRMYSSDHDAGNIRHKYHPPRNQSPSLIPQKRKAPKDGLKSTISVREIQEGRKHIVPLTLPRVLDDFCKI